VVATALKRHEISTDRNHDIARATLPEAVSTTAPEFCFQGILDQLVQKPPCRQDTGRRSAKRALHWRSKHERAADRRRHVIEKAMAPGVSEEELQAAYDEP